MPNLVYRRPSWPSRENDSSKNDRGDFTHDSPYVINQRANHPRLNRLCVTKTTKGDYHPTGEGLGGGEGVCGGYRCEMFPWGVPRKAGGETGPIHPSVCVLSFYLSLFDTGSLTGQYVTRLSLREPSDIRLYLLSCKRIDRGDVASRP